MSESLICESCGRSGHPSLYEEGQAVTIGGVERVEAFLVENGWLAWGIGGGWAHACPDCVPQFKRAAIARQGA